MTNWPLVTLASLCRNAKADIVDGPFGSNLKREDYITSGIPVLKIQNVKESGVILKKMDYVTPEKFTELSRHSFRRGDIVITKLGDPLGIAAVVDEIDEGLIVADLVRIRVDESRVDTRYLAYAINSTIVRTWLNDQQKGSTRPRVSLLLVRAMPIPLPPLDEQKRIVAKLDELNLYAKERHSLALDFAESAQDLLMGFLAEVFEDQVAQFDWPLVPFGDFAEHSLGKMLDKGKNVGDPRPYMRNANIQWFEIDTIDVQEMRIDERERERFAVRRGDLLICEGGYPGRCAIWNRDEEMYFQKALHRARFDSVESAKWAMYLLYFMSETGRLEEHFSGTGIQHLTGERLARVMVPLPPAKMRARLVERIEGVHQAVVELRTKQTATTKRLEQFKRQMAAVVLNGAA